MLIKISKASHFFSNGESRNESTYKFTVTFLYTVTFKNRIRVHCNYNLIVIGVDIILC